MPLTPGATKPPDSMVTFPLIVPVPARVATGFTVTLPLPVVFVTARVPSLTVVVPE